MFYNIQSVQCGYIILVRIRLVTADCEWVGQQHLEPEGPGGV